MSNLLPSVKNAGVYINTNNTTKLILDAFCTLTDYDGWSDLVARDDICDGVLPDMLANYGMLTPGVLDETNALYLVFWITLKPHAVTVFVAPSRASMIIPTHIRTLYADIAKADLESEDESMKKLVNDMLSMTGMTRETLGWKKGFDGLVKYSDDLQTITMHDCVVYGYADTFNDSFDMAINDVFPDDSLLSSEEYNAASIQLYDSDGKKLYPKAKTSTIFDDAGWLNRISTLEEQMDNFIDANTEKF